MKSILLSIFAVLAALALSLPAHAAIAEAGTYIVDKDHANVGFSISHLGISNVIGRFNRFEGQISYEPHGATSVTFEIQTDSVDTNQARRDNHIRSGDFLDTDEHPKMSFESTTVTYNDAGDPKTITGNMQLHGVTNSVTFDVTPIGAGEFPQGTKRAGYLAKTVIKRGDFGIDSLPVIVGEEVVITINVELIKQ